MATMFLITDIWTIKTQFGICPFSKEEKKVMYVSGNQTVSYKTLKVLLFTLCTKNILG